MPPDTEADSLCECVGHDIYLEGACLEFKTAARQCCCFEFLISEICQGALNLIQIQVLKVFCFGIASLNPRLA